MERVSRLARKRSLELSRVWRAVLATPRDAAAIELDRLTNMGDGAAAAEGSGGAAAAGPWEAAAAGGDARRGGAVAVRGGRPIGAHGGRPFIDDIIKQIENFIKRIILLGRKTTITIANIIIITIVITIAIAKSK